MLDQFAGNLPRFDIFANNPTSLNHIHLSPETLVSLYKDHLVLTGDVPVKQPVIAESRMEAEAVKPALQFDGQNRRHITLLLASPLTSGHTSFLANILKACRLGFDDTAILNMKGENISLTEIKSQLTPSIVLLFGISPLDISLPVNFPHFKIQAYDSVQYLYVPELKKMVEETEEAKLLKSKLWLCLKELFQL